MFMTIVAIAFWTLLAFALVWAGVRVLAFLLDHAVGVAWILAALFIAFAGVLT